MREELQKSNARLEIQRLEALLSSRKEEYEIFGSTSEDREADAEIRTKIMDLKKLS